MRTMASGAPLSIARIGSTSPLPTLTLTASTASCWITPALACTNTMSILMPSAAKNPFLSPTVIGHRLAEAEPTVPTVTLSAERAAGAVSRTGHSSRAAANPRNNFIAVLPLAP
jgi:hypothetical protein